MRFHTFPAFIVIAFAACAGLVAFIPASAQQTVIYRCTDAKGAVTMQNDKPCAPGMHQEVRNIGTLPTAPAPTRRADAPAAPAGPPPGANFELVRGPVNEALPASSLPEAERKPPPPLFQCETWDKDRYVGADAAPAPRCVPLQTVGIDGSSRMAGGEACEMKQDSCTALDGVALCQAWRRRVDEAQFRLKFAREDERDTRKAEYDTFAQALADSSCR
jgi:hypothetical protein